MLRHLGIVAVGTVKIGLNNVCKLIWKESGVLKLKEAKLTFVDMSTIF